MTDYQPRNMSISGRCWRIASSKSWSIYQVDMGRQTHSLRGRIHMVLTTRWAFWKLAQQKYDQCQCDFEEISTPVMTAEANWMSLSRHDRYQDQYRALPVMQQPANPTNHCGDTTDDRTGQPWRYKITRLQCQLAIWWWKESPEAVKSAKGVWQAQPVERRQPAGVRWWRWADV